MRIWIDFINTPQVSFFEPMIQELEELGHEFQLTCRNSSNTVQLLEQKGWKYTVIGEGVKKSLLSKVLSFPKRVKSLIGFLENKKIDLAIGQSSFYLPITSRFLKIPSIYTNDNEHALGNVPSFLFANKIFLPSELSIKKALLQGASKKKITQYPGIKEGVYLWKKGIEIEDLRKKVNQTTIYIRPEPNTAQYYKGKERFLDDVILELSKNYQITILSRDIEQIKHYMLMQFKNVTVPENSLEFNSVAANCLLFIGAGGSMTREMAMMGIPTISVYQEDLLNVDKYLISQNLMAHIPNLTIESINRILENSHRNGKINNDLLEKGQKAYELFKDAILEVSN
jgi:uncharacterized protein